MLRGRKHVFYNSSAKVLIFMQITKYFLFIFVISREQMSCILPENSRVRMSTDAKVLEYGR